MMHTHAIGIDIGGTKIAAGVVDTQTGVVAQRRQLPTQPGRGAQAVLDDTLALARELAGHAPGAHIGLGICELVNPTGDVTSQYTIDWAGVPVQSLLSEIAPARVEADVRAHARAEAVLGAGRGFDTFVFLSVGTGISSTLVQGGLPFAGSRGNALVLATGPVTVPAPDGGRIRFVLEEYASGAALCARAGVERAEQLFEAAAAGDPAAHDLLADAGTMLGSAAGWLASVLDPAAMIVGGGLGTAEGPYWDAFVPAVRDHIWSETTRTLPILKAALGPDAGIIGAALSAP
jgi:glucokinase